MAERHLVPALGHIQLKQLQPRAIQAYYGKAVAKLSPRTVAKHHRLRRGLSLDDLVFPSVRDKPLDPSVLIHNFTKVAGKAGRAGVRFHDLRHTFASLMLLRGAKPKVISEALGHGSVSFTMDVYSHIIEGMQSEAMALLDGVLPDGVVRNSVVKMPLFPDN